jgi:hypothetical protein
MITREYKSYQNVIIRTLSKLSNINKRRKDFICEVLILFLSIKGRINFLQLGRYGLSGEQRYRQQFEKPFDFLAFNKELVVSNGSGRYVIAFDPSYIDKSGKKTTGLGWYWSGCAGKSKWGLEIGGIAAIDIDNHTAFHLEAVQTLHSEDQTLTQWYIDLLKERSGTLTAISPYFVADAWFSKKPFVDAITAMGMHFVCRLRDDADLLYLYTGAPTGQKGRPKKYAGKIDIGNIEKDYFTLEEQTDEHTLYSGIVYSKSLKRNIRIAYVLYNMGNGKQTIKLYYSTDLSMCPKDILLFYQSRFQIEFLYRDGKQFTGLCDVQARGVNKLNFHFNASLTAINIAKVEDWLSIPKEERKAFSMSDIKTLNHNRLLLCRFFDVFGIDPNKHKNKEYIKELIYYGTIAA